jgi:hypothetical protein
MLAYPNCHNESPLYNEYSLEKKELQGFNLITVVEQLSLS